MGDLRSRARIDDPHRPDMAAPRLARRVHPGLVRGCAHGAIRRAAP